MKLPEQDRQIFGLVVYGGFKLREAAELMDISIEAMKVRIHRARKHLKDIISDRCNTGEEPTDLNNCSDQC